MGDPNVYKVGFGSPGRTKAFDDAARAKAKGVPKKRKWTKEFCLGQLDEILSELKVILRETKKTEVDDKRLKREQIRDLNTLMNRVLDFMKYLYPPVQQSVNVNIDTTADKVLSRIKEFKEKQIVEDLEDAEDYVTDVEDEKKDKRYKVGGSQRIVK